MINWHRLFGLTLCDYFTGTPYVVELEKDIARKRQVLDVLIIRGDAADAAPPAAPEPCDGLEGLRPHNLLTYKSGQESLDAWALEELIGHYVNYRKAFASQVPAEDFGLFAVSTRHPRELFRQVAAERVKDGVYRLRALSRELTLIVPREVDPHPRNALWALFSFEAGRIRQGAQAYHWRQPDHVPVLHDIFHRYQELGIPMSYTFDDFRRDLVREVLPHIPPEEVLRQYDTKEVLGRYAPEQRLSGLAPEERLSGLQPEDILDGLDDVTVARLQALLEQRRRRAS
jgi:hypothetical protein